MSCASCVETVDKALRSVQGVLEVRVNFVDGTATVEGSVSYERLIRAVRDAGYKASLIPDSAYDYDTERTKSENYRCDLKRTIISGAISLLVLIVSVFGLLPSTESISGRVSWGIVSLLTLFVLTYGGGRFFSGAYRAFRNHNANMDTLVAIATGVAWVYSSFVILFPNAFPELERHLPDRSRGYIYFDTAALIIAFVNLGSVLETRAKQKASQLIKHLIGLRPKTARVLRNGEEKDIPIEQLKLGEVVRVRPGEKLPIDGEIIEGASYVDESIVTGEPMLIEKGVGDEVVSGAINKSGSFLFRVTRVGKETTLARIVDMVRRAQNAKPPIGKLADRVSSVFVPSVLVIAVITLIAWFIYGPEPRVTFMLITSTSVLIIACPCALGLATPISIMVGVGKAAEYGVLIRRGDALQQMGELTTVVIDKTGTITEGKPQLTVVETALNWSQDDLLKVAASVERSSEHPLAEAIVGAAKERNFELRSPESFESLSGHGVIAKLNGRDVLIGNERLMDSYGVDLTGLTQKSQVLSKVGQIIVFVAVNNNLVGILGISDLVKADSYEAINRLREAGIKVVMLTGDSYATAKAIAARVGVNDFIAEALPEDKAYEISRLRSKGERVAMVGDGINDAPALAEADVGFSMGVGADVAIESAGVTLTGSSLHGVADAMSISKATLRNIKQNLIGAFAYNSFAIPIAAGVLFPFAGLLLNPAIAGAAMALSSVTVAMNANRLRRFQP